MFLTHPYWTDGTKQFVHKTTDTYKHSTSSTCICRILCNVRVWTEL